MSLNNLFRVAKLFYSEVVLKVLSRFISLKCVPDILKYSEFMLDLPLGRTEKFI